MKELRSHPVKSLHLSIWGNLNPEKREGRVTSLRRLPGPKEISEGAGKAINLRGKGSGSEQVTLI